jgi:hypothetical protein
VNLNQEARDYRWNLQEIRRRQRPVWCADPDPSRWRASGKFDDLRCDRGTTRVPQKIADM